MANLTAEAVLKVDIPSTRDALAWGLDKVKEFVRARRGRSSLDLLVVARELLENARVHGNRGSADLWVHLEVEDLGCGRFELRVEDEGEGFDFQSLRMDVPEDPRRLSRRGYVLICALSEEIRFSGKANAVSVVVLAR